ncbi:CapA family protein [Georgenia faecalis]|uniref:CapA family protein n=1 Tax=Georgenia faecalis TaxID=2483799 RepID=UPI000FD7A828|nr:CapA family protein [Georgenia faecalis]
MARHALPARRRVLAPVLGVLLAAVVLAVLAWRPWLEAETPLPATSPGATSAPSAPSAPGPSPAAPSPAAPSPSATPSPPTPAVFTVLGGGDVLPHATVIRTAATGDGYDFVPLMEPVAPFTRGADLALCNLEVPLAPPGTQPSGYPMFGAPTELVADLARLGWDGCSTSTNHSLDRGLPGLVHTLDALDAAGLGHVGTARTPAEADRPQLYRLDRAGQTVTVAHLGATYGTNGIPVPAEAPWAVTLIDVEGLVARAAAARADGADLVIVSVHCCSEYQGQPAPQQVEIAEALAASGEVDLVLGHHAHVPQPVARLEGGPGGRGMWAAYGLGNFISNQDERCCVPQTATGLLATATVVKPADGPARVDAVEWTAVTVDRVGAQRLYVLADLLAGARPELLTLGADQLTDRYRGVLDVVGTDALERTAPPVPTGPAPLVVPRAG